MSYVGDYAGVLTLVSILIAILGSFASLDILYRVKSSIKIEKIKGLCLSSVTIGLGFWTMHFIDIMSCNIHIKVQFDFYLTAFSLVFGIIASFLSFYILIQKKGSFLNLLFASFVMGIAIEGIHFLGLLAMHMEVEKHYNFLYMIIAFVFGVLCSLASYRWLFNTHKKVRLLSSIILGIGISVMHFTNMRTMTLHGVVQMNDQLFMSFNELQYSKHVMAGIIAIIVILFILTIIYLAYIDKFNAESNQKIALNHYQSLVEHSPHLVFSINLEGLITSVNPKGLEMLKFKDDQLINASLDKLLTIESENNVIRAIEDCCTGHPSKADAYIKNAEESFIPMSLTFIPIIVEKKTVGMFMIGKDTTDMIEYKERIKKAQRDLVATVRNHQGMIFKFIKLGDHFIHTLSDGELLYKFGLDPSKVVGRRLFDFLPDEYARHNQRFYKKAWSGEITSYEGYINGVTYLAQLRPIIVDGKVKEVIGSAIDISDKKRAESNLLKEKNFYQEVLNTMSEGILTYGANDEKIVLNSNVYSFYRMNEEELAKQNPKNTIKLIDESGSNFTRENYPVFFTQSTGKPLTNKIIGLKWGDDDITWLSVNTRLLKNESKKEESRVLLTMSDITLQKRHELALKESYALNEMIFNNLYLGILIIDKDRNVTLVNERFRAMFCLQEPIKDLIGSSSIDYYTSFYNNSKQEAEIVLEILTKRKPITEEITVIDDRTIIRSYIPFYVGGDFKGHLWTFEDITERKRLEQDRINAIEEAVEASRAKSEFLSKMSHELRTPLNGVLGFSQLLEMDPSLNSQQQSFVQEILKGGRHLLDLINEVLDLARIETGQLKVSLEHVKITDQIRECVNMLKPVANEKNIEITLELSNSENTYVYCDPLRLRQILINLIDNAIKYNVDNGKVFIGCVNENKQVLVRIKDTGIGIGKTEQLKVFDAFYRVQSINVEGTGIGLSIVKQLIHLMSGQIGLTSGNEGEGTEFWFRLPAIEQINSQNVYSRDQHENLIEYEMYTNILYIEDNLSNVQLVKGIFENNPNITLKTVMTGEEGIDLIEKQSFDLILLDINLPGMSGYEVLNSLKANKHTRNIPVIALSAYAMPDDIKNQNNDQFCEYITKPIDIPLFLEKVSKYLYV